MAITLTERTPIHRIIAAANDKVYYEGTGVSAGSFTELTTTGNAIDTSDTLTIASGFQKAFFANGTKLKVADFANTKIATTAVGTHPPDRGNILTGVTSGATMVVDYITSLTGACTIYGKRTSDETFTTEVVTGTDDDGNAISFTTSGAETAPRHWYNWTVYGNSADYGTMPGTAYFVARYRSRLVLWGHPDYPHMWWMSKIGNPFDFLYDADDPLTAVAGSTGDAGEIGDIIRAGVPYGDDFFIFGTTRSVFLLNGDPAAGGSMDEVSTNVGIFSHWSWVKDEAGNLYFYGTDGNAYRMQGGRSAPVPISINALPQLGSDWAANPSTHRVVLSFDSVRQGVLVTRTTLASGANTSYWFDLRTEGWYPESYPDVCGVYCSLFYPANSQSLRSLLLGCTDGYVRCFKDSAKDDDSGATDTAISSYMALPVVKLNEDDDREGKLTSLTFEVAGGAADGDFSDTDGFTYSLYPGDDPETCLEDIRDSATAQATGTLTAVGRSQRVRERVRAAWLGIKIHNSTASQTWALNRVFGSVQGAGRIR